MYMHVYLSVCVYVYLSVCVYVYVYLSVCVYVYVYLSMCVCMYVFVNTHTHTHTHTHPSHLCSRPCYGCGSILVVHSNSAPFFHWVLVLHLLTTDRTSTTDGGNHTTRNGHCCTHLPLSPRLSPRLALIECLDDPTFCSTATPTDPGHPHRA